MPLMVLNSNTLWFDMVLSHTGFPRGTSVKNCLPMQETKDAGSDPGLGRSPGEGHGNPLQYSFFLVIGHSVWEPGSPPMDQTHVPCSESQAS